MKLGEPRTPEAETEWQAFHAIELENARAWRHPSGKMKPAGSNWPGVFIWGDEALEYAQCLETLIETGTEGLYLPGSKLEALIELLRSCKL